MVAPSGRCAQPFGIRYDTNGVSCASDADAKGGVCAPLKHRISAPVHAVSRVCSLSYSCKLGGVKQAHRLTGTVGF